MPYLNAYMNLSTQKVDSLEKAEKTLLEAVSNAGRKVGGILGSRLVRPTAPHEWQVAIDIIVC